MDLSKELKSWQLPLSAIIVSTITMILLHWYFFKDKSSLRALPSAGKTRLHRPDMVYRLRVSSSIDEVTAERMLKETLDGSFHVKIGSLFNSSDRRGQDATVTFDKTPLNFKDTENYWHFSRPGITLDTHFYGITTIFSPEPEQHKFDLIAICGLGGHAFGSFKERGGSYMWLRDSLPKDFPAARIMLYGYDSHIHQSTSFQGIEALGSTLRNSIEGMIVGEPKPLIFIAHSLGGILFKQAIIQSANDPAGVLYQHTYGALFFGVPNDGMDISSLIPMASNQPNAGLIHSLSSVSDQLRGQSRDFLAAFNSPNTRIFCFYELQTSPTALQTDNKWSMDGPDAILVGVTSATHCRPWENHAHLVQGLNRCHSGLVKFRPLDQEYKLVHTQLGKMVEGILNPNPGGHLLQADAKLYEKIREWLSPPDLLAKHKNACKERKGLQTGMWFTDSDIFKIWKTSSPSFMWLHGVPGCGKTILSSSIIETLSKDPGRSKRALAYHYFDFNAKTTQNLQTLLKSLIVQLSQFHLHDAVRSMYRASYCGKAEATRHELEDTIAKLTQNFDDVFIVLDALDECAEREPVLEWLESISDRDQLHVLVNSRNETDIRMHLGNIKDIEILDMEAKRDGIDKDIRAFVELQLSCRPEFKFLTPELRTEIADTLIPKADGMFLWVSCQLDSLAKCDTPNSIRSALATIPQTLEDTYTRALERIDPGKRPSIQRIFQWLICSDIPLHVEELREVLISGPGADDIIDTDDRPLDDEKILGYCGCLVKTQIYQPKRWERYWWEGYEAKQIQLSHFTVAEYLLSSKSPIFRIQYIPAHFSIAGTCINYLLHLRSLQQTAEDLLQTYPLAYYASVHFIEHLMIVPDPPKDLEARAAQLIGTDEALSWWIDLVKQTSVPRQNGAKKDYQKALYSYVTLLMTRLAAQTAYLSCEWGDLEFIMSRLHRGLPELLKQLKT